MVKTMGFLCGGSVRFYIPRTKELLKTETMGVEKASLSTII